MPLDSYGVLSGTLHRHFRDTPDTQGHWFHVNLEVDAPAGRYRCAVDVDSKQSTTGVQWKVLTLAASVLDPVPSLDPGYHELSTSSGSGALDYQRHPALRHRPGCAFPVRPPARAHGPGGLVAAYVWDYADGIGFLGHFWDAAVAL
ncbi:DUF2278 family protein, partial [Streptomyces sp. WAC07061]|uniref:DUF2278 family protein n=1 Tax=Streptomyces sp. WAC07061 TaxID=2487410 RepID=UPI000F7A048D